MKAWFSVSIYSKKEWQPPSDLATEDAKKIVNSLQTFFRSLNATGSLNAAGTISAERVLINLPQSAGAYDLQVAGNIICSGTSIDFGQTAVQVNLGQSGSLWITSPALVPQQVVGRRRTGYTNAMTGTADRATAYDTSTITLVQLAERVKAIEDDLTTHGLIGP